MVAAAVLVLFLASSLIGNTFAQAETCDPANSRTFEDFDVTIQTGTSIFTGNYSGTPGFRARIDLGLRETTDTNFPFVALDLQISLVDVDVLEIRFKFDGDLPNQVKRYEMPNDTVSVVLSDLTEPVLTIVIVAFPAPDTNDTVQFTIDKLESCINPPIVVVKGDANLLTTLAAGQFRCPALTLGQDYHFYNPDDCTKFYECAVTNEIPAVQDCPAPLVFNPSLNICDWVYNSPCGDGSTTLCTSAPCLNGGSCLVSGATTYACSCPAGFSGENCHISSGGGNACSPSPCQNGGTCNLSGSSYSCSCPSGYTGTNCNVAVNNPCSPSPCQNGATCNNFGTSYSCNCPSGYTGTNCNVLVNACSPNPCQNGATCNNFGTSYSCNCPSGYTGTNCNVFASSPCSPNPCLNSGVCNANGGTYTCSCIDSFAGPNCTAANPCSSNPCNGGTCTSSGTTFTCSNCPAGLTGTLCNQLAPIVVVKGDANFTTICSSESLRVEVAVTENFTGLVYPENFVNNETCAYINMTDQNYVMTFFFNSMDCGAGWQVKDTFVEYSVKTIVQFNQDALYPTDRSHLSRCVFDNTFYIKDFVKADTDNPQLQEGNDTTMGNVTSFLFFGIQDPNNNALSADSEVSVGQVVNLRVKLKDNSVFSTVLVKNCIASNRPDRISFKYVWLQLIDDDGCPATDVLVPEAPVYATSNGDLDVTVKVKAFLFLEGRDDGRNELHFACDAMLCPAGNDSCAKPNCPSNRRRRSVVDMEELVLHGQGYNRNDLQPSLRAVRRRRAVEEDGNNVVTMGGSIKVVLDNERQASEVEAGTKPDLAHYMQHPEVQAIVVVLCFLLLALIVISITLAVILHRRNRLRKRNEADDVMSRTSSVRKMITPTTFIPHVQAFANPLPI